MPDHNLQIGDFVVDSESRVGIVVEFEYDPPSGQQYCVYTLLRSGNRWYAPIRSMRRLESFDKFELAWSRRHIDA